MLRDFGEGLRMILLLRHGETELNVEGRLQGRSQASLTEAGRAQVSDRRIWRGSVPTDFRIRSLAALKRSAGWCARFHPNPSCTSRGRIRCRGYHHQGCSPKRAERQIRIAVTDPRCSSDAGSVHQTPLHGVSRNSWRRQHGCAGKSLEVIKRVPPYNSQVT